MKSPYPLRSGDDWSCLSAFRVLVNRRIQQNILHHLVSAGPRSIYSILGWVAVSNRLVAGPDVVVPNEGCGGLSCTTYHVFVLFVCFISCTEYSVILISFIYSRSTEYL